MQIDSSFLCEYILVIRQTKNVGGIPSNITNLSFVRLSKEKLTAYQLARQKPNPGTQDQSTLLDGKLEATWQLLPADVTLTTLGHSLNIVVHAEPSLIENIELQA